MSYNCSYLVEKFHAPGVAVIAYKHNASEPKQTPRSHLANSRVNLASRPRQNDIITRLLKVEGSAPIYRDYLKNEIRHISMARRFHIYSLNWRYLQLKCTYLQFNRPFPPTFATQREREKLRYWVGFFGVLSSPLKTAFGTIENCRLHSH